MAARALRSAAVGFLLLAVNAGPAFGYAAGDLDTTFDGDGRAVASFSPYVAEAYAVAVQPDGKIVAAGYTGTATAVVFALARYEPDGSFDASFDADGIVTTAIGPGPDEAFAVAPQPDGKIVAAGVSDNGANTDFAVVRYNADGSLDSSFGGDGIVTTPIGGLGDEAYSVAVQADGKIIVVGSTANASGGDFAVVRYNADGSLDSSFDGDGVVITAIGTGREEAFAVSEQSDGRIVVAGRSSSGSNMDFALVRYQSDGTLDGSFDGDGIVTTAFGTGDDEAWGVKLENDGDIVAGGSSWNGADRDFALARYDANGGLDATFGSNGKVTTDFGYDDVGQAIALQSNGMVVVGGYRDLVDFPGNGSFALARYESDGDLDSAFGTNGTVVTAVGQSISYGFGVALQGNGNVVLAGQGVAGGHSTFALARYVDPTIDVELSGASDDYTGVDGFSFVWDTSAETVPDEITDVEETTDALTSPPLADGASHYLHLRSVDRVGNWSGSAALGPFAIDPTAPGAGVLQGRALSRAFQWKRAFGVAWSASDETSGVGSYTVSYRRAPVGGGFGVPTVWKTVVDSGEVFTGSAGNTYCFTAGATDRAGNTGAPGSEGCTAVPASDRQLEAKGSWTRERGPRHYLGSYSITDDSGDSLSLRVAGRRLALVATRCRRCGTVEVRLDSSLLKRIELRAATLRRRRVIPIASFSEVRGGLLTIRVVSSGKPVIVEGLGVSRI